MTDYDRPPVGAHRDDSQAAREKGERLDRAHFEFGDITGLSRHRDDSPKAHALNVIRGGGTRHHWRGVA